MSIEKLAVFSEDGEKNTSGLFLTDGFPRAQKPARQWFNWLFNSVCKKINELIDQSEAYKVGDIYLTTLNHADATSVRLHHGYGTWTPYAQARALVGVGQTTDARGQTVTVTGGQEFGSASIVQTGEQVGAHTHPTDAQKQDGTTIVANGPFFDVLTLQSATVSENQDQADVQPMNITPPSKGTYFWVRVA